MAKTHFCHISPINYLHLTKGREVHLTLAHLVDNQQYTNFYLEEKKKGSIIIMDNSAFEFTQEGKGYLSGDEIVHYAKRIDADYAVMTDYPGEGTYANKMESPVTPTGDDVIMESPLM